MKTILRGIFILSLAVLFVFPVYAFATEFASDDIYDAPGVNPYRDTLSSIPNEHIDPFMGGLTLIFEDIRLPGNGGLDLVIQRVFNSKNACNVWQKFGNDPWYCQSPDENGWLGYGWTLHFGRLFKSINVTVPHIIEMPDGSRHRAYNSLSGPGFITQDYWLLDASTSPPVVTLSNGTKIYYGWNGPSHPDFPNHTAYLATKIQDVNGNEININYKSYGSSIISNVVDSVGRTIYFNTQTINYAERLVSITGPGVSVSYTHIPHSQTQGITFLSQVHLPEGNPWQYAYNQPTYDLTQVTTPSGGVITYVYGDSAINRGSGWPFFYIWAVAQKTTGGTAPAGTWTMAYSQGSQQDYTQVTDPCGRTHKYKYHGYGEHLQDGNMWKIGLPKSTEVVGEETTTYAWTNSSPISQDELVVYNVGSDLDIYVPFLTQKAITRDGKTYTTTYSNHDNYGNPQTISESGDKTRNRTLTYWYNTTKNIVVDKLATETVSGGFSGTFTTNYVYDTNTGNPTQVTKYGVITSFTYYDQYTGPTKKGNLRTKTDANGHITTYDWDKGRISGITNPIYSISRVINSNGTIASETNGRGYPTSFTYDGNLRLTGIAPPGVNPTSFAYPANNSYKYETRGQYYIYHYNDGFGRPTGTLDIKGIDTDIVYKACGPTDYSTSNIGDTIYYDNFNRVEQITHKDNGSIIYTYSNSNVTVRDEANKYTYFTYNAFGNPDEKLLLTVQDALGYTTSYNYNILGSLTSITQGSLTRSFVYDGTKNFLTSESHPEKGTITYGRDNVGNMTSRLDSMGTISFGYDEINRLETINYGTGTISFTYDNADNRQTMANADSSVTYTHDPANRLTKKEETILGVLYTTQYSYDGNDNLTDLYYPPGTHVAYGYNNKNQVTAVTGSGWNTSSITYYTSGTQIGLPQNFSDSNGLVTTLTYNNRNLTTGISVSASTLNLTYGYDTRGNMTSMTDGLNALKNLVVGTTTYNYPTNNRLGSTTGGEPSSFGYNTDGDVTSYVNHLSEQYDLQYNRLHNLMSYNVHNGPSVATFAYDGDGMRIKKVSSQGTVIYHYDKEGRVISETDPNGNRIRDNIYLNGKLVAEIGSSGQVRFYHTDPAGTPIAMTDGSGSTVWRADYRPFGEEQIITETVSNDYQFTGKEKDEETGLHYFGARYMDSKIGRFLSPDPVGAVDPRTGDINGKVLRNPQRINIYAYGLNNPYRYIDPDGNEEYNIADGPIFVDRIKKSLTNPSMFRDFLKDPFQLLPSPPSFDENVREIGKGIIGDSGQSVSPERFVPTNVADNRRLFMGWLHSKSNPDRPLTKEQAREVVETAKKQNIPVRYTPADSEGHETRKWKGPHIHIGKEHIPVERGFQP
jgi:RHS repeat-associated protein